MKKLSLIFLVYLTVFGNLFSQTKKAEEVFEKWTKIQNVYEKSDFSQIKESLSEIDLVSLKSKYASVLNFLQTYASFFDLVSEEQLKNGFLKLSVPDDDLIKQKFEKLYDLLNSDVQKFVDYIKTKYKKNYEADSLENFFKYKPQDADAAFIDECRDLLFILFTTGDFAEIEKRFFTAGNKFFEYCFKIKSWPNFKTMLLDEQQHPVAKFLYSIIWWSLAGNGWKHWSADSLNRIKSKFDSGCEIVYIAGGSDVYQLIKNGVYKIRVIDPLLPSQPKYYSEGWDWLIKGEKENGIGDQITFDKVILKREKFDLQNKQFKAITASRDILDLDQSLTVWGIYDIASNKRLGEFKIERRFCNQSDFANDKNKAIAISFNELYFIATPESKGGWGINPNKFSDYLYLYVKQLHSPVSAKVVRNLRDACEQMEFNFIALGTCIN